MKAEKVESYEYFPTECVRKMDWLPWILPTFASHHSESVVGMLVKIDRSPPPYRSLRSSSSFQQHFRNPRQKPQYLTSWILAPASNCGDKCPYQL